MKQHVFDKYLRADTRNARLNIFATESMAKGGSISCIVPMASHVDHTEHDVQVIVTEQGVEDLRWKTPCERAELLIENCAHPDYKPMLWEYFERAKRVAKGQHTPHDLRTALSWHQKYLDTGAMKQYGFYVERDFSGAADCFRHHSAGVFDRLCPNQGNWTVYRRYFPGGVGLWAFWGQNPRGAADRWATSVYSSVGLSAGPTFVKRLTLNGRAYALRCLIIVLTGSLVCAAIVRLAGVYAPLVVGMMTGAFTTLPGFAAAKEAVSASPDAAVAVAAGYGIIYRVGVVCKVLFIQLIPRVLHTDMGRERAAIALPPTSQDAVETPRKKLEPWGLLPFSAAVFLGILLGAVTLPLPGGGSFLLGTTGGPLVMSLLISHIGRIGPVDLRLSLELYGTTKEIGLMLFFSGAGVEGGLGLAEILSSCGPRLLLYGFALVAMPLAVGILVFYKLLRLPLLNGLGSIIASMTCTPSLAVLIQTAGTDDVAAAYATTYPIALITLVLAVQVLVTL